MYTGREIACMYVYVYIYIYIYIYTHTYICQLATELAAAPEAGADWALGAHAGGTYIISLYVCIYTYIYIYL